jgi:hypothetical protein
MRGARAIGLGGRHDPDTLPAVEAHFHMPIRARLVRGLILAAIVPFWLFLEIVFVGRSYGFDVSARRNSVHEG